jgi:flagellar biosynthetic protein FliR
MLSLAVPLQLIQVSLFVFVRIASMLFMMPLFDMRTIPIFFKVALALGITFLVVTTLNFEDVALHPGAVGFGLGIVREVLVGVILGISVRILFAAVQLAGQTMGMQMGMALANVMDPSTQSQGSVISLLVNIIAILLFLTLNAHHAVIRGILDSFQVVPPYQFTFTTPLFEELMRLGGEMFALSVKIGAPVIVALLLTSAALGLVARTVPQMNVFIVAFPIKILVGLFFLAVSIPFMLSFLKQLFESLGEQMNLLLSAM